MKHLVFTIALCAFSLLGFSQVRRPSQGINWQTKAKELQKEVDQLKYVNDSLDKKLNFFLQQERYKPLAVQVDPSTGTVYELKSVVGNSISDKLYVSVTIRITNNTNDQYIQFGKGEFIDSDGESEFDGASGIGSKHSDDGPIRIFKGVTVNGFFRFFCLEKHAQQMKLLVFKDKNTGKEFKFENIDIFWED